MPDPAAVDDFYLATREHATPYALTDACVIDPDGTPTVLLHRDGRLKTFRRPGRRWLSAGRPLTGSLSDLGGLAISPNGRKLLAYASFTVNPDRGDRSAVWGSWFGANGWAPQRKLSRRASAYGAAAGVDESGTATVAWGSMPIRVQVVRWTRGKPGAPSTLARRDAGGVVVTVTLRVADRCKRQVAGTAFLQQGMKVTMSQGPRGIGTLTREDPRDFPRKNPSSEPHPLRRGRVRRVRGSATVASVLGVDATLPRGAASTP
jgi:hypothetical protein